ncbi:MAG: heme exporter protein D [Alteromonadaceae bacterium]|jgi:heme exporter protein D
MHFESFADLLNMGGYALYVWLSYGFSLLVLVGVTVLSLRQSKQIKTEILQSVDREKRINQAKEADLL